MTRFIRKDTLQEMATVYRNTEYNICITVNPDPNHIGNPYFKIYNSTSYTSADKGIRISFLKPSYIMHADTKASWKLNKKEKQLLISFLLDKSNFYDEQLGRKLTVWEML